VAVGVERTLALLPVLVGVIKAGSTYLPLDPSFPAGRLRFMLEDSGARLLVHQAGLLDEVADAVPATLPVDDDLVAAAPATPVDVAADLSRVIYVMYTSGSTGTPKGVAVGHRALGNFLKAMADLGLMGPDDAVIALTNPTFDISMDELLLPLVVGAKVVVAGRATAQSGESLLGLAAANGVTVLHGTPTTCRLLLAGVAAQPDPARPVRGRDDVGQARRRTAQSRPRSLEFVRAHRGHRVVTGAPGDRRRRAAHRPAARQH
jgi:non-ribosomal peptide synthetase component F